MDLSIVIINWNSAEFTRDCIASIGSFRSSLKQEIIVVDNASSDNSLSILSQIDGIVLIASPENLGFAKANNLGVQRSRGRAILFLNPDTVVVSPAIERMAKCLEFESKAGGAGCRLLNTDRTLQTTCVQPFPTIANQLADIEWVKQRTPRMALWGNRALFETSGPVPVPVEAISGACLMVTRNAFDAVGGFTTDYFMYGEDIDLCYKISAAGWRIYYVPDATVVHHGGKSSKQRDDDAFGDVVTRESIYKFLKKTRGPVYAATYRAAICLASLIRLLVLLTTRPMLRRHRHGSRIRQTARRWTRILKWSLGLEPWAKLLSRPGISQ